MILLVNINIYDINPLLDVQLENTLSCSVGLLFTWLIACLTIQKLLSFVKSHPSTVNLNSWVNGVLFGKSFPSPALCVVADI